jgi:hypothetical protein
MTPASRLLRFTLFAAGLVGLIGLTSPTQGQGQRTTPKLVLSVLPNEPSSGEVTGAVSDIALRPNAALPFYVYVEAGSQAVTKGVFVKVTSDAEAKELVAEGKIETLDPGKRTFVKLTPVGSLKPAALAVPAAPTPAPTADAKAPPPLPGVAAPSTVYVWLLRDPTDHSDPLDKQTYRVRLAKPREYINAQPGTPQSDKGGYSLTVTLSHRSTGGVASKILRDAPAKARLVLRDDLIDGLDPASLKDGTYATTLPPLGQNVQLVAKNLRFADGSTRKGKVLVTLDDYDRAYVFDADFSGGTTPKEDEAKSVRIDAPRYAVPGKPFAPRLAVFNDPTPQEGRTVKPVLRFHRAEAGDPEVVTGNLTTSRDQTVNLDIGKGGELAFATRVRDWAIPLDTAEVYGPRKLSFTLEIPEADRDADPTDPAKKLPNPTAETTVTFDDTPPGGVQVFDLYQPKKARQADKDPPPALREWKKDGEKPRIVRGTRVQLVIGAVDPESQIGSVLVFTGPPPLPDGKPAPGGKIYPLRRYMVKGADGKDVPSNPPAYTTIVELPDAKGPFAVNYRIVNRAGLMVEDVAEATLIDPPATGTIEGKVIQGSTPERPQPNLTVALFDAGGKAISTTTTNDAGEFAFEDLPPGPYLVFCNKEADQNANDRKPATVKAGETTTVTLELKR